MEERYDREQYFFDDQTVDRLANFVSQFDSPCCICCPSVGKRLVEKSVEVTILDIDERFADLPGFQHFDLTRPTWTGKKFGVILCDPPFFNVSLSQLLATMKMLAAYDLSQRLLISYLTRRTDAVEKVFEPFCLKQTRFQPGYKTVAECSRNEIAFWSNLTTPELELLERVESQKSSEIQGET